MTIETEEDRWAFLAALWSELAELPENAPRLMTKHYLTQMGLLLDSQAYFAVIGGRNGPVESDPLEGWRIVDVIHQDPNGHWDNELIEEFSAVEANILNDPGTRRLVCGQGMRAYLRRTLMHHDDPPDCPSQALMDAVGASDRIVAAVPVSHRAELYIGFDRATGRPDFVDADVLWVRRSLTGLPSMAKSIALWYGLTDDCSTLTPRERDVLAHLLDGLSERRIAEELNLTQGTVHQYIVALYRKLRVSSRPELMALWIHRGRRSE